MAEPARQLEGGAQEQHNTGSERDVAARRIGMRQNALTGGGLGDGAPAGKLQSVPSGGFHSAGRGGPAASPNASADTGHGLGDSSRLDHAKETAANAIRDREQGSPDSQTPNSPNGGLPSKDDQRGPGASEEKNTEGSTSSKTGAQNKPQTNDQHQSQMPATVKAGGSPSTQKSGASPSGATSGNAPTSSSSGAGANSRYQNLLKLAGQNRGKLVGGGGIAGIFFIIIMAFVTLAPFKLESFMENELQKRITNRIEYFLEKRIDKIVERYIEQSTGNSAPKFVNTGRPIRDLYKTWRVARFESQLGDQQNLTFVKNAEGGIDMYKDGSLVGNLSESAEAQEMLAENIRTMTQWWQWYRRLHLRKWISNAYDFTWGKYFDKEEDKPGDPVAEDELNDVLIGNSQEVATIQTGDLMDCFLATTTGGCPQDEEDDPEAQPDQAYTQSDVGNGLNSADGGEDGTVESGVNAGETTAGEKAKQLLHQFTIKYGAEEADSKLANVFITIFGDEVGADLAKLLAQAKGPLIIIGLVDIGSRIDHFFYSGGADHAIVATHKVEYAAEFATWLVINDELKDGTSISASNEGAIMEKLSGMEGSAAYECNYLNNCSGNRGQNLTTITNCNTTAVKGCTGGTTDATTSRAINENATPVADWYRHYIGNVVLPPPVGLGSVHDTFAFWYDTGGKIWGLINDILGKLGSFLFNEYLANHYEFKLFFDWATAHIGEELSTLLMHLLAPAVTGTESGPDLANGIDAGATVTGMDFARNAGGMLLSPVAATQVDSNIASEVQQQQNQLSFSSRLFSTSNPQSLVDTIALVLPSSPSDALSQTGNYVASVFQNPFNIFNPIMNAFGFGSAQADNSISDSPANDYGLWNWGFTNAQLDSDDTAALNQAWANAQKRLGHTPTYGELELDDCPPVNPTKQANLCRLDIMAIQSLGGNYTKDADGGLGD